MIVIKNNEFVKDHFQSLNVKLLEFKRLRLIKNQFNSYKSLLQEFGINEFSRIHNWLSELEESLDSILSVLIDKINSLDLKIEDIQSFLIGQLESHFIFILDCVNSNHEQTRTFISEKFLEIEGAISVSESVILESLVTQFASLSLELKAIGGAVGQLVLESRVFFTEATGFLTSISVQL